MEDDIILVTCHTCECNREIAAQNVTVVQNATWETYDYAYLCMICGTRQVLALDPNWLSRMFAAGCKYQSFTMPVLSGHPGGPPLDQNDVKHLVNGLANNDYLAAYA